MGGCNTTMVSRPSLRELQFLCLIIQDGGCRDKEPFNPVKGTTPTDNAPTPVFSGLVSSHYPLAIQAV